MKRLLIWFIIGFLCLPLKAQLESPNIPIINDIPELINPQSSVNKRSASKPTACTGDTSTFPSYGSTAYNTVSVRKGAALGQFFGAPQKITVSGFRFFAFSLPPTPARSVKINLICNLYKAGIDSLPSGSPIASDTITVDTVMGSNIPLSRITCNASFGKDIPVDFDYIITVESDSTDVSAGLVCNSWANGDGKFRNLGVGSVSGIWYRCLSLNIGGTTFNSHMQLYPFVNYKVGTDFTFTQDCYANLDTLKFDNQSEKNVFSSIYYNRYVYSNLERICHRWNYDNRRIQSSIDGKYKPTGKNNMKIQLISTIYPYTGDYCRDTATHYIYFNPTRPRMLEEAKACKGDTVTLTVTSDLYSTVKWYHSMSDTTPFFEGTNYVIKNAQDNDTFYLKSVNYHCESKWNTIPFTVYEYPTILETTNDSICAGATANLGANTDHGVIKWYSSSDLLIPVYQGDWLQTEKLNADTSYYVIADNNGCFYSKTPVVVKALVGNDFAPEVPNVTHDTFVCLSSSSPLIIEASIASKDTIRWFNDANSSKVISYGPTYTYSSKSRGTESIYVETWNGICGSGRTAVNIQTKDPSSLFGPTGAEACENDTATLFASVPWGQVYWYWDNTLDTSFHQGPSPKVSGFIGEKYAYIQSAEDECFSKEYDSVLVKFIALPKVKSVLSDPVCAKSEGSITVNPEIGKVYWFEDSLSDFSIAQGNQYNFGIVFGNKNIWYEVDNEGCKSPRKQASLSVKPRPVAGFTYKLAWQHRVSCTPITTTGLDLNWDWGDESKTTGLPALHQYKEAGDYTIELIVVDRSNLCSDSVAIPVLVSHVGILDKDISSINIYPNPVSKNAVLSINGLNKGHYQWMDLSGRYISDGSISQEQVHIPNKINTGIYLLRVVNGKSTRTFKVYLEE